MAMVHRLPFINGLFWSSLIVRVTEVCASRRAIHTVTLVAVTCRRIGPASTRGMPLSLFERLSKATAFSARDTP